MWSFKLLFSLSLCLFMTACGWQPLYTTPEDSTTVSYSLKIATIPDRHGQILRNFLVDMMIPEGTPPEPKYILKVVLTEEIAGIAVAKNENTIRKEATLTGLITLTESKTKKVVHTHTVKAINSFAVIGKNYYADIIAEDYAIKEASRLLAEKIRLVVSIYLKNNP